MAVPSPKFCFSGCKIENFGSIDLWASKKKTKIWGGNCHIDNIEPRSSPDFIKKNEKKRTARSSGLCFKKLIIFTNYTKLNLIII